MNLRSNVNRYRCLPWVAAIVAAMFLADGSRAQSTSQQAATTRAYSREERLHLLNAMEAELKLRQAAAQRTRTKLELEDTKALYEEKIETINELRKAEQAVEEAEIAYAQAEIMLERTRLDFLKNATLIRVVDAMKYRGEDGVVMASIKLLNDSDIEKARVVIAQQSNGSVLSANDPAALLSVDNIIVTLWGEYRERYADRALLADPFQQVIPKLKYGQSEVLKFKLLKRDVEYVTVEIEYLDTSKQYTVFLKKEALQDLPTIASAQGDQQGDLGSTIRYNLQLERLAKTDQSFHLRVLNFPSEIPFAFIDPATEAKMTTLKFTSEESTRQVDFEVSIPEKLDRNLIDTNIPFYIVVARPAQMKKIRELNRRFDGGKIPAEEVAKLKASIEDLVLIPKGVGKLDILVGNLFKEIVQEQDVVLKFNILNSGTLDVYRVRPEMDLPLEWESQLTPEEVEVIEPDQKVLFTAQIKPPIDVAVGEYTIKVECEGHSGVEVIEAKEKDFTVRVVAQGNLAGTLFLVIILVLLVLGIAIASVKISRR